MGQHLDIERISIDNKAKIGVRKFGYLINQGDKLTAQGRKDLQKINREKYGLTPEYVASLKLPAPTQVKIYNVDKIINSRGKLSTVEKLNHMLSLQSALQEKLKTKREIKKQDKLKQAVREENPEEKATSSLDEESENADTKAGNKEA